MYERTTSVLSPTKKKGQGLSDGTELSSNPTQKSCNPDRSFVPKVGKRNVNPFSTTCTTATLEEKAEVMKNLPLPPSGVRTLDYAEAERRWSERQSQTGSPGAIGAITEVTIKYSPENSTRTLRRQGSGDDESARARSSGDERTLAGSDNGKGGPFDDDFAQPKKDSEEGSRPRTPDWDMKGNSDPGNVV